MAHTIANKVKGALVALFAACIAFAATPGLAAAVQLADPQTITVNGLQAGDTVKAYKIVETTVGDDNNVTSKFVDALSTQLGNTLTFADYSNQENSDETKEANAQLIAAAVNTLVNGNNGFVAHSEITVKDNETSAQLMLSDYGQYLIVVYADHAGSPVYKNTIISVNPKANADTNAFDTVVDTINGELGQDKSITVKHATVQASLGKTINNEKRVDNVTGGDTVTFKIHAMVPQYKNTADRTFAFTDVMSKNFTREGKFTVLSDNKLELVEGADYTVVTNDVTTLISLTKDGLEKAMGYELSIMYKAVLSEKAEYDEPNTNHVSLEYSTDSNTGSTSTLEDTVYNVVYGLSFKKVNDETTPVGLKDAEFAIYKKGDYSTAVATAKSLEDGSVSISGALGAGIEYELVETKAPAGYEKLTQPIDFTIKSDPVAKGEVWTSGKMVDLSDATSEVSSNQVVNHKNPVLPVTGGTGTVALTAAGVVLLAGAATVIVRSRKQN